MYLGIYFNMSAVKGLGIRVIVNTLRIGDADLRV